MIKKGDESIMKNPNVRGFKMFAVMELIIGIILCVYFFETIGLTLLFSALALCLFLLGIAEIINLLQKILNTNNELLKHHNGNND